MTTSDNEIGFSLTFDKTQLDKLGEVGKRAVATAISLTAQELWGNVRKEAPTDHGRLAGSFELEQRGELTYAVTTAVEYALVVQEGSGEHWIEPKDAKALWWEGAAHPFARVWHPGTKPNPYVDRAIDATSSRIEEFVRRAVQEAAE